MTVDTKWGWIGGQGSLAEDIPEALWQGRVTLPDGVTDGPLTYLKSAAIIGNENAYESSLGPGDNRVIQQSTVATQPFLNQTPANAKHVVDAPPNVTDKSPDTGKKGGSGAAEIIKLVRSRRLRQDAPPGVETGTQTVPVNPRTEPVHNLHVREPAPVPKELDPNTRIGNLGDYHERSAWTGSGPQGALHENYSKVGSLLALAGVPPRPLPDDSLLVQLAMTVDMEKTAGVEYLTRTDVHPLKLAAELSDTLGDEWLGWEPETIRATLIKDAGVDPSDDVMSKIMAVKIIMHRPDIFYDDWHALEKIAVTFNDQSPLMGQVEDVPVEWLSNAVAIVSKLAGGAGDFGPETTKYVAARLRDQGYVVAPPLLRFADDELGKMVQDDELRKKVILSYAQGLEARELDESEDPISIQVNRLLRNNAYVLDRLGESRSQLAG
jgi:hypothetical protein